METRINSRIQKLQVESPCHVPWDSMEGSERTRYCRKCKLHVHNVSAMSREEADLFLVKLASGERHCGRIYRRPDGTVMSRDCRKVLKGIMARRWIAVCLAAAILSFSRLISTAANASGIEEQWYGSRFKVTYIDSTLDRIAHQFGIEELCTCSFTMGLMICP